MNKKDKIEPVEQPRTVDDLSLIELKAIDYDYIVEIERLTALHRGFQAKIREKMAAEAK